MWICGGLFSVYASNKLLIKYINFGSEVQYQGLDHYHTKFHQTKAGLQATGKDLHKKTTNTKNALVQDHHDAMLKSGGQPLPYVGHQTINLSKRAAGAAKKGGSHYWKRKK